MKRKNSVFLVFTVALICIIIPCLGHTLFPHSNFSISRNRRQSNNCRRQFACDNNNECVHFTKVCNGQKDCTDGSDEDPTLCNETTVQPIQQITLNSFCPARTIKNGEIKVQGEGYIPGAPVPNYSLVNILCNSGYSLIPPTNLLGCVNGTWNLPFPECIVNCPAVSSTHLVDVVCTVGDKPVNCNEPLVEGTVVISTCKNGNKDFSVSVCTKGYWDTPPTRCEQDCGKALSGSYKDNGQKIKPGKFPWHVGVYRLIKKDYTYQCGGSIISPLIILTVAHCFTDFAGKPNEANEYFIGGGKYYNDYMANKDTLAQKRQVKEIHIPFLFKGGDSKFAGDVAVVVVKTPFMITNTVSPVCLDLSGNQFGTNSLGKVVTWRQEDPTDEFNILDTYYIDGKQCANDVSANFKQYITFDKFCGKMTNGSEICRGNSGIGIFFETKQKYYIRGVLSVGDIGNGASCISSFGVYTDLTQYSSFIQEVIARNTVTDQAIITCPSRTSNSVIVNCTLSGEPMDCSQPVPDGTVAISTCKNFYTSSQGEQSISTCSGGSWDKPLIRCEPECGEVVPDGEIYITEGQKAKRGKFPWPVGIYHLENGEFQFICGGSIITPSTILSVAHCFKDHADGIEDRYPAKEFYVAAGKYLSDYNAAEELAQKRQVHKIYTPPMYRGVNLNYVADLAVVELKEPFEMSNVVRPVCINWNGATNNIKPNDVGVLVGWGYDSTGQLLSRGLNQLNAPYIDFNTCMQNMPQIFHRFMTNDKFCAGYTNGSSICRGDSGNGLIFNNNKEKYYIGGVASTAPAKFGQCGTHQYAMYTKISSYLSFIKETLLKTRENEHKCTPVILDSVHLRCILNGEVVNCWDAVDGTIAISTCKDSYISIINKNMSISRCSQGSWDIPFIQCVQAQPVETDTTCSPRRSDSVNVKCIEDDKPVNCNKRMKDGTVVISECKDFYVPVQGDTSISVSRCTKGSWNTPLIQCKPLQPLKLECGEVSPTGETYAVNASTAKRGEYPWHVALYRLLQGTYGYTCGGSIITPLIVITAAHCFTTEYGKRFPAEEFFVGAGKYYSDYDAEEDEQAQQRQVKEYHLPPIYRGYETNFQGDLAVTVLTRSFEFTNVVQPVCIEWDNKIEVQQLQPTHRGNVVGWGTINPYDATKPSRELKQLSAPFIDVEKCLDNVPQNFRRWITTDKFCAGYTNGSSVCKGDSGGGMVFEWHSKNKQKYYIRGVVSVGPQDKQKFLVCDNYKYGAYTKVSVYSSFILKIINENK